MYEKTDRNNILLWLKGVFIEGVIPGTLTGLKVRTGRRSSNLLMLGLSSGKSIGANENDIYLVLICVNYVTNSFDCVNISGI